MNATERKPRTAWSLLTVVKSESNPKTLYRIALHTNGTLGCSCPAWVYGKGRRECKHLIRFRQSLELSPLAA